MAATVQTACTFMRETIFMVSAMLPDWYVVNGVRGEKILTQKLKGEWLSNPLILAISIMEVFESMAEAFDRFGRREHEERNWARFAANWEEKRALPDWQKEGTE